MVVLLLMGHAVVCGCARHGVFDYSIVLIIHHVTLDMHVLEVAIGGPALAGLLRLRLVGWLSGGARGAVQRHVPCWAWLADRRWLQPARLGLPY